MKMLSDIVRSSATMYFLTGADTPPAARKQLDAGSHGIRNLPSSAGTAVTPALR
jgi:hypothetical protein